MPAALSDLSCGAGGSSQGAEEAGTRYQAVIVENVVNVRDWELFEPWLHAVRSVRLPGGHGVPQFHGGLAHPAVPRPALHRHLASRRPRPRAAVRRALLVPHLRAGDRRGAVVEGPPPTLVALRGAVHLTLPRMHRQRLAAGLPGRHRDRLDPPSPQDRRPRPAAGGQHPGPDPRPGSAPGCAATPDSHHPCSCWSVVHGPGATSVAGSKPATPTSHQRRSTAPSSGLLGLRT